MNVTSLNPLRPKFDLPNVLSKRYTCYKHRQVDSECLQNVNECTKPKNETIKRFKLYKNDMFYACDTKRVVLFVEKQKAEVTVLHA
jgi:hypothetical protein